MNTTQWRIPIQKIKAGRRNEEKKVATKIQKKVNPVIRPPLQRVHRLWQKSKVRTWCFNKEEDRKKKIIHEKKKMKKTKETPLGIKQRTKFLIKVLFMLVLVFCLMIMQAFQNIYGHLALFAVNGEKGY